MRSAFDVARFDAIVAALAAAGLPDDELTGECLLALAVDQLLDAGVAPLDILGRTLGMLSDDDDEQPTREQLS
jgi:hypothetical protein